MKQSKKAFTLVELIVVAVILTILATVGFISYEEYLVDTRDSKRLSQLAGLRDGLRLAITKGKLPLPDNHVEIRNNGTAFLYQGYAGENVLEGIAYSEVTKDPFDDTYYTYLLSRNRRDFQVLGFLEEYNPDVVSTILPQSYALDYSQRFPQVMGKKLGVVLEQDTNTPLQEIPEYTASGYMDLQDTTTNLFDAYVTDTYLISGKENDLVGIIPFTTCKKIKQNGGSYGNGIYNINPTGLSPFEVYCDMETDGGGWTLVARSASGFPTTHDGTSTILSGNNPSGDFGWLYENGSIRDDTTPYSLGANSKFMNFGELLLTAYDNGKNIVDAYSFDVNSDILKDINKYDGNLTSEHSDKKDEPSLTNCNELLISVPESESGLCEDQLPVSVWGNVDYSYTFWFNWTNNYSEASHTSREYNSGLMRGGYRIGYNPRSPLYAWRQLNGKQGMIFVR